MLRRTKVGLWGAGLCAWLGLTGCGSPTSDSLAGSAVSPASQDGRARLLAQSDPATVAAIDGLGSFPAQLVYTDVATFSDARPQLTGSVQQACQGLSLGVKLFGATPFYQLLGSLSPGNGQSLLSCFAGNLDPVIPQGQSRCQDALRVVGATQQFGGRNPEVIVRLSPNLNSMPKFNSLRLLAPGGVPPQQRQALKALRDSLTYPGDGQRLQKAMKVADLNKYLDGTFDPKAFGFQAVVNDVASLTTPAQVIEGLRLDYPGGFQGETEVGLLQYFQDSNFHLSIPYSPANGGNRTDAYPFAGNGFTATVMANAIPEWLAPGSGISLQDGSQLWLVQANGTRQLRATLQQGHWVNPQGSILPRQLGRRSVEAWADYHGQRLYVISEDDDFSYVYLSGPAGENFLLDQVQVGPAEYRGKVPRLKG